ncbi:conserved oligomeric Golgi complex subunit 2-like protein [Leptotrombidium deliense]|uniref:Conserved oligomeric Golgi complex subunit 2 n=1 Tax=Leptotrombidium deliense TaxID=299467 RepID=A0A443S9V7_9ACAR|nr:conserved oligomeric Golgi complex subunit 2-like protein [Leptotrombidium deliense]
MAETHSEQAAELSRLKGDVESVLPAVPANVCFTSDEFLNESFSVDEFVKKHRRDGNMEQLREDLSAYLRSLRLSMIDLINEDYSDFVNLSSNLVGLDKNIDSVKQPLKILREEIISVDSELSGLIKAIDEKMKALEKIRDQKDNLQRILYISSVLNRVEELSADYWGVNPIPVSLLERLTLQMNEVNASLSRISLSIPLLEKEIKPKAAAITCKVNESLEENFLIAVAECNVESFELCVKICKLSGQLSLLEKLLTVNFVRPAFSKLIIEENLETMGVNRFFDEIIGFITSKCKVLFDSEVDTSNFMLNSVWQEIAQSLLIRTTSLFSCGSPDLFHVNYNAMNIFIKRFVDESRLELQILQCDRNYEELMSKFNLTVYFHIRFRETVNDFEKALEKPIEMNESSQKIQLSPINCLMNVIQRIWSPHKIYIQQLFHSFFKLSLLILNRFSLWLQNYSLPKTNENTNAALLFGLLSESDILLKQVATFFDETIVSVKPLNCELSELKECFQESLHLVRNEGMSNIEHLLRECLVKQCNEVLKQISDIPRLYRKTNRDSPSKPSNYVNVCIDTLKEFVTSTNSNTYWKSNWTIDILERVTKTFKSQTIEVLTSVQKMEDSLRRLKKLKGSQQKNNQSISDDDKIRKQLNIDANEYAKKIETHLGVEKLSVSGLHELLKLVETAKS